MNSVAILEDQRIFRDILGDLLRGSGFEVTTSTGDAQEFLSSVRAHPPTVAVIDLLLGPDFDSPRGLPVLVELRRWLPDVRAVVISGAYDPALVTRCYEAGAAGYLDKNEASLTDIAPVVRQIANGDRIFPMPKTFHAPSAPQAPALASLTIREHEVLRHVTAGSDNLKIAASLDISERTVRAHISALYRKLGADNRTELALLARKLGVVPFGDA